MKVDGLNEYVRINITNIAKLVEEDKGIQKTEKEINVMLENNRDYIRTPFPEFQARYTFMNRRIIADVQDWVEENEEGGNELGVMIYVDIEHDLGCIVQYIFDENNVLSVEVYSSPLVRLEGERKEMAYYYVLPILYSIVLMHCKNIVIKDAEPKKWKGKPRTDEKKNTYKILDIIPFRNIVKAQTNMEVEKCGIKKALHLCRGHLRTYEEIKPLFGKYTGTFFIHAHTRGDSSNGIANKDYRVLRGIT